GAEPVAQRVRDGPEAVGIEAVDASRDDRDAADLTRGSEQIFGARARELALQQGELSLEVALLVEQLAQPLRHVERRGLQEIGGLAQRLLLARDGLERRAPRDRLDAADAGGDRALGLELDEPELT